MATSQIANELEKHKKHGIFWSFNKENLKFVGETLVFVFYLLKVPISNSFEAWKCFKNSNFSLFCDFRGGVEGGLAGVLEIFLYSFPGRVQLYLIGFLQVYVKVIFPKKYLILKIKK